MCVDVDDDFIPGKGVASIRIVPDPVPELIEGNLGNADVDHVSGKGPNINIKQRRINVH